MVIIVVTTHLEEHQIIAEVETAVIMEADMEMQYTGIRMEKQEKQLMKILMV